MIQQVRGSMLRQTMHARVASKTQTIQSLIGPNEVTLRTFPPFFLRPNVISDSPTQTV